MASPSVKDSVLPPINVARVILDRLGFRSPAVSVLKRVWSGASFGEGTPSDTTLVLSPIPKARVVTRRESATDAGTVRDGDWKIGPITPAVAVPFGAVEAFAADGTPSTGTGAIDAAKSVLPTGVTQGDWQLVVQVLTGGVVGGGSWRYSVDDGTTWSAPQGVLPATFQVPGIGILLTLSGTFVTGDQHKVRGTSCGYTAEQLSPTVTDGRTEVFYVLSDSNGTFLCTKVRVDLDRQLRSTVYVRHTNLTP